MSNHFFRVFALAGIVLSVVSCSKKENPRQVVSFNQDWQFALTDTTVAIDNIDQKVSDWRLLDLPHDWSIEGAFDEKNPAGTGGGALPGGTGWYRKGFSLPQSAKEKRVFIQFDGVYQNSSVWVNGQFVGNRPNGYISFEYDITPYLHFGDSANTILVKADNAKQPNSRWYSGSGIYRDVRLVTVNPVYIPEWGTHIVATPVSDESASLTITTKIKNHHQESIRFQLKTKILDLQGATLAEITEDGDLPAEELQEVSQDLKVDHLKRWTLKDPALYTAVSQVYLDNELTDEYTTRFGVRSFEFDKDKGFFLNGESMKLQGVCLHHDLGCLGTAFNKRAAQRQLEILKGMGVNAIRTSHNPPAPQFLDLCDEMGLIVMDEMFDMWALKKSEYDYAQYWDEWHKKDLEDFVYRDRNHPSVMIWSVGNEIIEQYAHEDSTGGVIAKELAGIVRALDATRPITTANNDPTPDNPLIKYGGLDLVGYNYHHEMYADFPKDFPGRTFIATETNSSLATRGHYDMPSDSVRVWPIQWDLPFTEGNPDQTVSAYDNVRTPWGSLQEDTWRVIKKYDFLSGMFIWTGFDYLGEPTPYGWPSRSSYFGIVDLAGFPKDTYYMYQSVWTEDTVLHVFPHWNLPPSGTLGLADSVDVWAYYSHADEVELFLNGKSLGTKSKEPEQYHVMWRVKYEPGTLKAVSRQNGSEVMVKEIHTAGAAATISLEADRTELQADGTDLSFVTVSVLDKDGNVVPYADNLMHFELTGSGKIVGVDNGDQTSLLSLKGNEMKVFNGKCLVVIQSSRAAGTMELTARNADLNPAHLTLTSR